MKYAIILDQFASKIVPSESGIPFKKAVQDILEYVQEAGYSLQEDYFLVVLDSGVDSLDDFPVALA
jgi:hypothetical protein